MIVVLLHREVVRLGAGENNPPNGARTNDDLADPSCFATAWASPYSKPDGFLIVVPVTRPFQNPGAGTSKPTVSVPALIVGAADWAAKAAAVVTADADHDCKRQIFPHSDPPWELSQVAPMYPAAEHADRVGTIGAELDTRLPEHDGEAAPCSPAEPC